MWTINIAVANAVSGVIGLGTLDLTSVLNVGQTLRLYTTGGPVKILYVFACNTSAPGVWYFDMALGGLSLGLSMSVQSGRDLYRDMLKSIGPHMKLYENKEITEYTTDGLPGVTHAQALGQLADLFAAGLPKSCDVMMVSSIPYAQRGGFDPNQNIANITVRENIRALCDARDYLYFDGYGAFGEQAITTDALYGSQIALEAEFIPVWNAGTVYSYGQVVGNYRYINAGPSAGNVQTNTAFWTPWNATYNAGTTYRKHDVVGHGSFYTWSYINDTPGAGVAPPTAPTIKNTHWQMLVGMTRDGTHTDKPADAYRVGLLNSATGIAGNPHSFTPGPVNETFTPSKIAGGSTISYGKIGQDIKFSSPNPITASVWDMTVSQKLHIYTAAGLQFMLSQFGHLAGANLEQYAAFLGGAIALDGDGSNLAGTAGNAILRAGTVAGQAGSVVVRHRTNNTDGNLQAGAIVSSKYVRLPSYTVGTVPSASASVAGAQIYVTNEVGGATPATSDGTSWRRDADRAIIA
jgi:hypothetical protein